MAASIDARAVALLAGTAAAASYLVAKRQFERKAATQRQEQFKADREASLAAKEEGKKAGAPPGTKVEELGADGVYLWECERLGKYFPSAGKSQAAYDTLVGDQECIL